MSGFSTQARGIAFMILGGGLYSIDDALAKMLTSGYSIVEIVFFSYLFSLIPLFIFMPRSQGLQIFRTQRLGGLFLRSIFGCAAFACFIYSFSVLPLADAYVLSFIAPLFIALLSAPFLGEKVERHQWIAIFVGFGGILIMMRPDSDIFDVAGFIAILGGFCYAASLVLTRKFSISENNSVMYLSFAVTGLVSTAVFLPFQWRPPALSDLTLFFAVGLLTYFSQMAVTEAFRLAPASVVGPFDYAALIWASLLGYLIWGDLPDGYCIAGGSLVVLSGLFLIIREVQSPSLKAAAAPVN